MDVGAITPDIARELELPRGQGGAVVTRVERSSAASAGGVAPGDVILEINREPVTSLSEVTSGLRAVPAGSPVFMTVWRNGQRVFIIMRKR
jgi:serine protease Do